MAQLSSEEGLALIPRTRTVSRRRTKAGRYVSEITYDELAACFDLPKEKAAERLGVGVTILKRICRRMGISRWPYRRDYHKPREYSGVSTTGDSDGDVEPAGPSAALTGSHARRGTTSAHAYHHIYAPHHNGVPAYSPFTDAPWPPGFDVTSVVAALAAAGAGPAAPRHPVPYHASADLHRSGSAETEIISIGAGPGASAPPETAADTQGGLDLLLTAINASGDGDEDAAAGCGHSSGVDGPAAPAPASALAPTEALESRLRRAIETNPDFAKLLSKVLQENAAATSAPVAPPPQPQPAVPDITAAVEGQLRDELSRKFLAVQAELAARRQDLTHLETYISSRMHASHPAAQMAAALQQAHAAHAAQVAAPVFGGAHPAAPATSQMSSYLSSMPRAASGWGGYPAPSSGFAPWGQAGGWGQQ